MGEMSLWGRIQAEMTVESRAGRRDESACVLEFNKNKHKQ